MKLIKKTALISAGLIVVLGSNVLTGAASASARQLSQPKTVKGTTLVASAAQGRNRKSRTSTSSHKQINTCTIPKTMTIHNKKGRKIKTLKKGTKISFNHSEEERLKDKYIKIKSYERKGRSTIVKDHRNQMYLRVGSIIKQIKPTSKGDSGLRLDMPCVAPQEVNNEPKRETKRRNNTH